ncbi:osmoprotectant transport system permease protein [Cohnella sp. SGD-V74]|uniref:ABC transporter permease n=1 Tax=unclassified Cohnella TaxID=2636738 RepID=UPI000D413F80|nr:MULTISPECIES: ABC transporter permease [unclassified Cohnella]PRX66394.1 osmoprotectant transport system permease protein [Cohnella sp. SGD-V74]
MKVLDQIREYFEGNAPVFFANMKTHVWLSSFSMIAAMLICIPLGIWISRKLHIANYVINAVNIFRVIPSLAVLALMMPLLGVGFAPAAMALTLLAGPPILINTYVAFREINPAIKEAAKGMGMTPMQTILKVELPLALPVMLAGIRTASVEIIASATLAVLIGGGGLGSYIINGVSMMSKSYLLIGAIPVALLAILSEIVFSFLQRKTNYSH